MNLIFRIFLLVTLCLLISPLISCINNTNYKVLICHDHKLTILTESEYYNESNKNLVSQPLNPNPENQPLHNNQDNSNKFSQFNVEVHLGNTVSNIPYQDGYTGDHSNPKLSFENTQNIKTRVEADENQKSDFEKNKLFNNNNYQDNSNTFNNVHFNGSNQKSDFLGNHPLNSYQDDSNKFKRVHFKENSKIPDLQHQGNYKGKNASTNQNNFYNENKNTKNEDPSFIIAIRTGIQETTINSNIYFNGNRYDQNFWKVNDKQYVNLLQTQPNNTHNSFHAYAPYGFWSLRNFFDITSNFNESFKSSLIVEDRTYYTEDMQFIIELISIREQSLLTSMLPEYFIHFSESPLSLLPQIFGLYCLQHNGNTYYLLVKANIFPFKLQRHVNELYHISGVEKELHSNNNFVQETPLLRDHTFIHEYRGGLIIPLDLYSRVLQILEKDVQFLKKFNLTDYEFKIVITKSNKPVFNKGFNVMSKIRNYDAEVIPESALERKRIIFEYNNNNLIGYIGITNILQQYVNPVQFSNSDWHPEMYSRRFIDFISRFVFKSATRRY